MKDEILLRYRIPLESIEEINIEISARQRIISFYEGYLIEQGHYEYVHERISFLVNEMCEYMIAHSYSLEGSRAFREGEDLYSAVEADFKICHPNLNLEDYVNRERIIND